MNKRLFAISRSAFCAALLLTIGTALLCVLSAQAQEKKEEVTDTTKHPELRYYVNYGYRGSNPSAVNAELTKADYSGLPDGALDVSFGYKRFYPSNWLFGFDVGATFGGTRNQRYNTSAIGIYDRIWGGYRFVNTDAVKVYAAAAVEPNLTFTTTTERRTTSFSNYLANPVNPSPTLRFNLPQINVPLMVNAELKLPRWFGESYDTFLGFYAGYSFNLYSGLSVLGDGGTYFTDAPKQPAGGFQAGISLSFDWAQALKGQMETFGNPQKH
jgi:hypothetical protein